MKDTDVQQPGSIFLPSGDRRLGEPLLTALLLRRRVELQVAR